MYGNNYVVFISLSLFIYKKEFTFSFLQYFPSLLSRSINDDGIADWMPLISSTSIMMMASLMDRGHSLIHHGLNILLIIFLKSNIFYFIKNLKEWNKFFIFIFLKKSDTDLKDSRSRDFFFFL